MFLAAGATGWDRRKARALRLNGTDERQERVLSSTSTLGEVRTRTFSVFVRPNVSGVFRPIYSARSPGAGNLQSYFGIDASNRVALFSDNVLIGGTDCHAVAGSITQDVWTHVVLQYDSTQGTASNRVKVWIDGASQSVTYIATPSLNLSLNFGVTTYTQAVGYNDATSNYYSGDMTLLHVVEGSAVAATEFADTIDGTYQAKLPSLSYGTNGCFLSFADASDLGNDSGGGGNDHSLVNIDSSNQITDGPPSSY